MCQLICVCAVLLLQVAKLKQKVSERSKRHGSVALNSLPLKTLSSSPESKRRRHGKVIITMDHWRHALEQVRPSVSDQEKAKYQRM